MDNNDDAKKHGNVIPFDFAQDWKSSKSAEADDHAEPKTAQPYGLMTDDKGKPINNISNALAMLQNNPVLKDCIVLDVMLQAVCLAKPLPGSDDDPTNFVKRPITDHEVTCIQVYMQHLGLTRIGKDMVHQAVDQRAQENKVHPIRDWLLSTTWDGVERVGTWLTTYLGVVASPYTEGVGRMSLIAMVARIMEPGCKVDHMLVFEGPQGISKSAVCRILGGAYFSDTLPEINGHKDAYGHLAGKWIIEAPEMSAMTRAETNKLKAFITGTVDQFRPPYGRKEIKQPRQCVFIGTINKSAYLKDETGGRRFWPVRLGEIDLIALQTDRDQLFAEALALYNAKTPWHPSKEFEKKHIAPEQEDRYDPDPWEPIISAHLQEKKPERVYLGDLFDLLHIEPAARLRNKQSRLTAILDRVGWKRSPSRDAKGNVYWKSPSSN